jgi:hypothetical protein
VQITVGEFGCSLVKRERSAFSYQSADTVALLFCRFQYTSICRSSRVDRFRFSAPARARMEIDGLGRGSRGRKASQLTLYPARALHSVAKRRSTVQQITDSRSVGLGLHERKFMHDIRNHAWDFTEKCIKITRGIEFSQFTPCS